MSLVWVTRALPAARATAERVEALGLEAVVAPLLEVRSLGEGPIDLAGVEAIAFTSANGVKAFAQRSQVRHLPVFAVGTATAGVARSAGFTDVKAAQGDVDALAELIRSAADSRAGLILHGGAAELAGDLVGALSAHGLTARRLDLYESLERTLTADELSKVAAADIALVHSPRAAALLRRHLASCPMSKLKVLCLSSAVKAPLQGVALGALGSAAAPTEESLLAGLALWSGRA